MEIKIEDIYQIIMNTLKNIQIKDLEETRKRVSVYFSYMSEWLSPEEQEINIATTLYSTYLEEIKKYTDSKLSNVEKYGETNGEIQIIETMLEVAKKIRSLSNERINLDTGTLENRLAAYRTRQKVSDEV